MATMIYTENTPVYSVLKSIMDKGTSEAAIASFINKQVTEKQLTNPARQEVVILNTLGEIAEMGGQYLGETILVQQTHRVKDNEGKNFQVRRLTEKQLETVIRDIVRANNIRLA